MAHRFRSKCGTLAGDYYVFSAEYKDSLSNTKDITKTEKTVPD